MKAEIDALKARIAEAPATGTYPVHVGHAPGKAQALPYVVLGVRGWSPSEELPLCGAADYVDEEVRVKAVASSADAVLTVLGRIRDDLSPNGAATVLAAAGRVARIKFVRSEFVDVDTSVTYTDGTNPTQGVHTYRITSQPTG